MFLSLSLRLVSSKWPMIEEKSANPTSSNVDGTADSIEVSKSETKSMYPPAPQILEA